MCAVAQTERNVRVGILRHRSPLRRLDSQSPPAGGLPVSHMHSAKPSPAPFFIDPLDQKFPAKFQSSDDLKILLTSLFGSLLHLWLKLSLVRTVLPENLQVDIDHVFLFGFKQKEKMKEIIFCGSNETFNNLISLF